jgi:hypothetical protein
MGKHRRPNLWIQRISRNAYTKEDNKQNNIKREENVRNIPKPYCLVRKVMKQYGNDACTHTNGEPSVDDVSGQPLSK